MAHEHRRAPARPQPVGDQPARAHVEMGLGLVQDEQVGIGGQRAREQHEPPLASRELAHAPRLGHAAQPELSEQVGDQPAVGLLGGRERGQRVVVLALEQAQALRLVRGGGELAGQALQLQLGLRAVERVGDGGIERQQLAIVLRDAAEHEALLAHDLAAVRRELTREQPQQASSCRCRSAPPRPCACARARRA